MSQSSWPPRWLTPVPQVEQNAGDGDVYAKFAEAVCRVTKDSVASPAGKLLILRDWQKNFCATHLLAKKMGAFVIEPRSLEWLARMASQHLQLQWVLQV